MVYTEDRSGLNIEQLPASAVAWLTERFPMSVLKGDK